MVYLGKNLVGIPEKHEPSFYTLWRRLEAFGNITAKPHGRGYRVHLLKPGLYPPMIAIRDTFYECLVILYKQ